MREASDPQCLLYGSISETRLPEASIVPDVASRIAERTLFPEAPRRVRTIVKDMRAVMGPGTVKSSRATGFRPVYPDLRPEWYKGTRDLSEGAGDTPPCILCHPTPEEAAPCPDRHIHGWDTAEEGKEIFKEDVVNMHPVNMDSYGMRRAYSLRFPGQSISYAEAYSQNALASGVGCCVESPCLGRPFSTPPPVVVSWDLWFTRSSNPPFTSGGAKAPTFLELQWFGVRCEVRPQCTE